MKLVAFVAALGFVAGCASTRPPQELVDARAAYARAYVGPAAQANVAGLHDAKKALDDAEEKFADDPSSDDARHLAYIAHRRVLLAETNARTIIASTQRARVEQAMANAKTLQEDPHPQKKARSATTP